MATLTIPWNDGNGNIILTYTGQGDGTVTVQSDTDNLGADREQVITLKTADGTRAVQVTIQQATGMLTLRDVNLLVLRDSGEKILR
ncbi:MAG: hypothetical protein IKB96_01855, partial [Prevotella sp.]|nr:hypothetical protein [Prevotella sp.]